MEEVGLRELRQNASELIRRVEAGEEITITVSGRPAAKLIPIDEDAWKTWDQVKHIWRIKGAYGDWDNEKYLIDPPIDFEDDPWER